MTTAVLVDAHAGWDVEVEVKVLDGTGAVSSVSVRTVLKFTKETFYVHSGMELGFIREVKNP